MYIRSPVSSSIYSTQTTLDYATVGGNARRRHSCFSRPDLFAANAIAQRTIGYNARHSHQNQNRFFAAANTDVSDAIFSSDIAANKTTVIQIFMECFHSYYKKILINVPIFILRQPDKYLKAVRC